MEEKGSLYIPDEYMDDINSGKMCVDYDNSRLYDTQTGQIVEELSFTKGDDDDREGMDPTSVAAGAAAAAAAIAMAVYAGKEILHTRKIKREQKFDQLLLEDEASQEKRHNLMVAVDLFDEEKRRSKEAPSAGLKSAIGNLIYALEQLGIEERKDYRKALAYASQSKFTYLDFILGGKSLWGVTKKLSFKKQVANLVGRLRLLESQLPDVPVEEAAIQKIDDIVVENAHESIKSYLSRNRK